MTNYLKIRIMFGFTLNNIKEINEKIFFHDFLTLLTSTEKLLTRA